MCQSAVMIIRVLSEARLAIGRASSRVVALIDSMCTTFGLVILSNHLAVVYKVVYHSQSVNAQTTSRHTDSTARNLTALLLQLASYLRLIVFVFCHFKSFLLSYDATLT